MNRNAVFSVDTRAAIRRIEQIICEHLPIEDFTDELVHTICGEDAYVSFVLANDPGEREPSMRVLTGVIDEGRFRPYAGMLALWDLRGQRFSQLRVIIVDGRSCGPDEFLWNLEAFLRGSMTKGLTAA